MELPEKVRKVARSARRDVILHHPSVRILHSYDTELFIFINNKSPRTAAINTFFHQLSFWFTGGWAWIIGVALFWPLRHEWAATTLKQIALPIWITSLVVEGPVKEYFRRRRPFSDIVRVVVVGKRPNNWSFPSGHSATAFAGARMLERRLPRWRGLWYALASLVGFSRIYLGAHYPGDVVSGSLFGLVLAEVIRWLMSQLGLGGE
jgi:undecaprenyl-diphosphatase